MRPDDDVPLDLRLLRTPAPPGTPADDEIFVRAVMDAVRRRRASGGVTDPLLALREIAVPFLAAASLVIAVLAWRGRAGMDAGRPRTVAEAVGVPREFFREGR